MVKKDWTFEEAYAADESALRENPERSEFDPTLPFTQWVALHHLDNLHIQYKQGDKFALMQAIRECARCDLVMPPWVVSAYIKAFDTVLACRSNNWNEVFGKPYPEGTHLNALRKQRLLKFAVLNEVNDILKRNPERPIDNGLFEEVGEKFHIGKTQAQKYYYLAKKITKTRVHPDIDKLLFMS